MNIDILKLNKDQALNFRQRRHSQWTENYQLYRDTVITNRLTQRQSVNIPLMKETIKGQIAKVAELVNLYFKNKDNDQQKELFANEYWKDLVVKLKMEVLDIIDKKNVMLYGRSFRFLNIRNGKFEMTIEDPQDVLVDRYVNPWDLETAGFVIQTGIYKRLESILKHPFYDKDAVNRLNAFYATRAGLIKNEENTRNLLDRNKRLEEMGAWDINDPTLGQTYVELEQHFTKEFDKEGNPLWKIQHVIDNEVVMDKPLKELLGIDFLPIVTWADDIERTDFWSDGIADIARVPNQVANVWFSQLVENRTLRNFGMQFYDATAKEDWQPNPVTPTPFAWFPVPGRPSEVLQRMDIPDLSESMDELQYVTQVVERATASTAISKGMRESGVKTLGEFQTLAANADERITAVTKYSNLAWKETGEKMMKMAAENDMEPVTLYKENTKGKVYSKKVKVSDFLSKNGYEVEVITKAEKQADDLEQIQLVNLAQQRFPNNAPLTRYTQKKYLELIGAPADVQKEVLDFEDQAAQQAQSKPAPSPLDQALGAQGEALQGLNPNGA